MIVKKYTDAEVKAFRKKYDKENRSDHEKSVDRLFLTIMVLLAITAIVKFCEVWSKV